MSEPVRQHYSLATGKGLTPAPSPNPRTNFINKSIGTASNPHPNPMKKKAGRGR
jgi:hypothetical protein